MGVGLVSYKELQGAGRYVLPASNLKKTSFFAKHSNCAMVLLEA